MLIQDDTSHSDGMKEMPTSGRINQRQESSSNHLLCPFVWWTALSLIASILIALGFWLPYWIQGFYQNINVSFSPFRRCNFPVLDEQGNLKILFKCIRYERFQDIPSIHWKLTTLLVGLGVLLSLLVALILLFSCCIPQALTSSNTFCLVLLQILIVLVIIVGCIFYPFGLNQNNDVQNICGGNGGDDGVASDDTDNDIFNPFGNLFPFLQHEKCHPSLSAYLLASGVLLLFTCLIFGLITRSQLREDVIPD